MNKRIVACLKNIEKDNLDALLVSNPVNITYLTGFRRADGYLLIHNGNLAYFTTPLFYEESRKLKIWKVFCPQGNIFHEAIKYASGRGVKRLGFEAKSLPYLEFKTFRRYAAAKRINLIESIDMVEDLRMIKSRDEISFIRKAAEVSREAFDFAREIIDTRITEKILALELERFLKIKGDNETAFPPIVAFGKASAYPHHIPDEKPLQRSKFFLIDLGAKCYGYAGDLTRVFFLGKMPIRLRRLIDAVRKAQELAIKRIKDGVQAKDVDLAARNYIEKKGYGKYFLHGTGHGVGLCVHEKPYLNRHNTSVLKEGMTVTVEPAVYLSGRIGIRIEDMVLVKKNKGEIL